MQQISSFAPEGLETMQLQNGCSAFISPAGSDLCLKLKSSMTFASFQAWPDDLQTTASSTSLLPIDKQTPTASIETSGGKPTRS
jgi:hypothetical protein